jgi:glycosyltransferase involved in cell wall biosynthesis
MPVVSVVLLTFNHERFVAEAIRGILRQSAAADMELVWHDDASTDATVGIGEAALAGAPFPVKRIHRRHNRYSLGIPFLLDVVEASAGEFIAVHEGDDVWLADDKIADQLAAFAAHPAADIAFTRAAALDAEGHRLPGLVADYGETGGIAALESVIAGDGGFMPSSSVVLRSTGVARVPRWAFGFQPINDYTIQVFGALRGGAIYLPTVSTGYRVNHPGAWTVQTHADPDRLMEHHGHVLGIVKRMQADLPDHARAFDPVVRNHLGNLLAVALQVGRFEHLARAVEILR